MRAKSLGLKTKADASYRIGRLLKRSPEGSGALDELQALQAETFPTVHLPCHFCTAAFRSRTGFDQNSCRRHPSLLGPPRMGME